jgi:hypothetical protein
LLFGVFFIFWLVLKALNSPKLFRGVAVDLLTSKEISIAVNTDSSLQITALKKHMLA